MPKTFFCMSTKFILLDDICLNSNVMYGKYIRYLSLNLNPNVSYMTNCLFYELTVEHGVEVGAGGGQDQPVSLLHHHHHHNSMLILFYLSDLPILSLINIELQRKKLQISPGKRSRFQQYFSLLFGVIGEINSLNKFGKNPCMHTVPVSDASTYVIYVLYSVTEIEISSLFFFSVNLS